MFSKIIKKCDFIGVTPRIFYKGHFRYKTISGGLLSIIILSFLISITIYFLHIFLSKKSFTIYENTVSITNPIKIWKKQDLSINVLDKYFNRIENASKIFSIYANIWSDLRYYENGEFKSKTEITEVPIEICNISSFEEHESLWKDEKFINESFCFSKESIDNKINSTRSYGDTNYTGIVFWITLCTNSSYKNDCYPLEESKKILDNVFIYVKILNYYFDHNLIDNNIIPYIKSDLIQASASIYKREWFLFQEVEYITDEGEIFNKNKKKNIQIFSSFYNSVDNREKPTVDNSFFALSLNMEGNKKIINRKYYKIQNLLADINGFFQIIYFTLCMLNYIYCFNKMNEEIINNNISNYIEFRNENIIPNLSPNSSFNRSSFILMNNNKNKKKFFTILNINKNYGKTVVKNDEKKTKNSFSFTPIRNLKNEKIISKDINEKEKKFIDKIKSNMNSRYFSLKFFQKFNPLLFFYPKKYFNSNNNIMKNFAFFEEVILHQLDVNQIIHKLNFIDKFEISFLSDKKRRLLFNYFQNPKIKLYMNNLFEDNNLSINFDSEKNGNEQLCFLKEIINIEINDKINNESTNYFL